MKLSTAKRATYVKDPNGVFWRVDCVIDDNTICIRVEDTGEESEDLLSDLVGWVAYELVPIKD